MRLYFKNKIDNKTVVIPILSYYFSKFLSDYKSEREQEQPPHEY